MPRRPFFIRLVSVIINFLLKNLAPFPHLVDLLTASWKPSSTHSSLFLSVPKITTKARYRYRHIPLTLPYRRRRDPLESVLNRTFTLTLS
jgi:hypothetical protein